MNTPTAQEVFDTAVGGVLRQGKRCVDTKGRCVYRGPNGMKCAAGFVFTDEEVDGVDDDTPLPEEFESCADAATVVNARAPRLLEHCDLLYALQDIHDQEPVEQWSISFRLLATDHDLSAKVIDQWEAEQTTGGAA